MDANVDGGMCDSFGATQVCRPYCGLPCPRGSVCAGAAFIGSELGVCVPVNEGCSIGEGGGTRYYCLEYRACLTWDHDPYITGCVDPEYCRWLVENPEERPNQRCRYSDGTLFESGPPHDDCAPGADPIDPFCGGSCGDCPVYPRNNQGCIGVSDARGFGVCVPLSRERCRPSSDIDTANALAGCSWQMRGLVGGDDPQECLCMLLSPTDPPDLGEVGWAVSQQTCRAYRDRYPGEVRCVDVSWTDVE